MKTTQNTTTLELIDLLSLACIATQFTPVTWAVKTLLMLGV